VHEIKSKLSKGRYNFTQFPLVFTLFIFSLIKAAKLKLPEICINLNRNSDFYVFMANYMLQFPYGREWRV
jgi:hypothetical protein